MPDTPAPSFAGLRPASRASSKAKQANRATDTRHERALRSALWRLGLRFRKHPASLPGKPDIVFASARVVVFCDGDFWHGRNWPRLRQQLSHRHNPTYWRAKILANRRRDRLVGALLGKAGWQVVRVWETDVVGDPTPAALAIQALVLKRRFLLGRTTGAPHAIR